MAATAAMDIDARLNTSLDDLVAQSRGAEKRARGGGRGGRPGRGGFEGGGRGGGGGGVKRERDFTGGRAPCLLIILPSPLSRQVW